MISVLLVDDDPQIQKLFVQFLRSKKIDVTSAVSGEEALKSLENSIPDLILLDLSLPGISGLDCLKKIKKINPVVPVA
ncbi:MAG: response regulator, partial [Candidatus Neomarinimicrobiota bacterium]